MENLLKGILTIFLKGTCPLCDRPSSSPFCPTCEGNLQHHQHRDPGARWQNPLPVFAWGEYEGKLKRAIATMKYQNHPELARPFGYWLGAAWLNFPDKIPKAIVVPLPMHAKKRQQRGFDQAELIARHFAHYTNLPWSPRGLERVKETQAMAQLGAKAREANLNNALRLGPDFQKQRPRLPVLLLDDVYTTGTTARTGAAVLEAQGIKVAGVAALATPRFEQPRGKI